MHGAGKREIKIKTEETQAAPPRKWGEHEIESLLECLMKHGHKNFEKMQESVPDRTLANIKLFLRTTYDTAGKMSEGHPNLDAWIKRCCGLSVAEAPWRDSLQIAQVMKYLSVDGLLENHPHPERCQGINFADAYRLIYQAMMGYPIQPVNEPTTNFVLEVIGELTSEVNKETEAINNVRSFFTDKFKPQKSKIKSQPAEANDLPVKKPLKVYERKKPKAIPTNETPSLKIVVQANTSEQSDSNTMQDFSVTFEGQNEGCQSFNVHVPVPHVKTNEEEQRLLKSSSFNPLEIPEKWLTQPVHLNLLKKL